MASKRMTFEQQIGKLVKGLCSRDPAVRIIPPRVTPKHANQVQLRVGWEGKETEYQVKSLGGSMLQVAPVAARWAQRRVACGAQGLSSKAEDVLLGMMMTHHLMRYAETGVIQRKATALASLGGDDPSPESEFLGDPERQEVVIGLSPYGSTLILRSQVGPFHWDYAPKVSLGKEGYQIGFLVEDYWIEERVCPETLRIGFTDPLPDLAEHVLATGVAYHAHAKRARELLGLLAAYLVEQKVEVEPMDQRILMLGADDIRVPLGDDDILVIQYKETEDCGKGLRYHCNIYADDPGQRGKSTKKHEAVIRLCEPMTPEKLRAWAGERLKQPIVGPEKDAMEVSGIDLV